MIIYQTLYLGFGSWADVEKLTLDNKDDVILELSCAADMDNGRDLNDIHVEYHPTKRAAEQYMQEFNASNHTTLNEEN